MTLRDLIARVPPKPDPNKYGNSFAGDAAYNEDALHHAISQLAVAREALREFGHHTNACRFRSNVPNPGIQPGSCTCGLEAAMEALKP